MLLAAQDAQGGSAVGGSAVAVILVRHCVLYRTAVLQKWYKHASSITSHFIARQRKISRTYS